MTLLKKAISQKCYNKAIEVYNQSLERMPEKFKDDITKINSNIAICFMRLKKFEEAIVFCTTAIELSPNFVKAKVNRAEAFYQTKQYEKCIAG